jgi:hypothetical protein
MSARLTRSLLAVLLLCGLSACPKGGERAREAVMALIAAHEPEALECLMLITNAEREIASVIKAQEAGGMPEEWLAKRTAPMRAQIEDGEACLEAWKERVLEAARQAGVDYPPALSLIRVEKHGDTWHVGPR